jgi:hypothetical protein
METIAGFSIGNFLAPEVLLMTLSFWPLGRAVSPYGELPVCRILKYAV